MNIPTLPNPQKYYQQVWQLVRQVPHGRLTTYGQIAKMIPPPDGIDPQDYKAFGSRWVGHAMAACPPDLPWQRVINAQGKISNRPGAQKQRQLLESEGIQFVNDKVKLATYRWPVSDEDNRPTQARLF